MHPVRRLIQLVEFQFPPDWREPQPEPGYPRWYYALVPDDVDVSQGLPAQQVAFERQPIYGIRYFWKDAPVRQDGTLYRFSPEVIVHLHLGEGQRDGEKVLYKMEPFTIPADMVQRQTVEGWQPLA